MESVLIARVFSQWQSGLHLADFGVNILGNVLARALGGSEHLRLVRL